jgi:hypothetical protein
MSLFTFSFAIWVRFTVGFDDPKWLSGDSDFTNHRDARLGRVSAVVWVHRGGVIAGNPTTEEDVLIVVGDCCCFRSISDGFLGSSKESIEVWLFLHDLSFFRFFFLVMGVVGSPAHFHSSRSFRVAALDSR